jgi:prepilin peptidase CpaA
MWQAFVVAFAVTVAAGDAWMKKIPRELSIFGLLAGLGYHAWHGGFLSSFLTACLAFVLGLGFYELKAIGGGDVKLLAAMGAILGFQGWMLALEVAILVAGVMALVGVIRKGLFLQTLRNMGRLLKHFATRGLRPHPEIQVNNPGLLRIPFGVAAAFGTVCTLVLRT